jgi:hypothetical protein
MEGPGSGRSFCIANLFMVAFFLRKLVYASIRS